MTGPRELPHRLSVETAGDHRNFECRLYGDCLSLAVSKGWKSFSCQGCERFLKGERGKRKVNPRKIVAALGVIILCLLLKEVVR